MDIQTSSAALQAAIAGASRGLVERGALVETIALAAVAGEHLLVIGPPGTAKSEAVRRVAKATGGRYFEYLLGRFTEPSEIFGPVDLRKLREGLVETETKDMLPEAEIAFLDEIFLGSTAILNTLLGLLNERVFRRGHTLLHCPLRLCVGASNALPDEPSLAAFADRFLVRVFIDPIPDPRLEELLEGGWSLNSENNAIAASLQDIDVLSQAARQADLSPIRPLLAQAIRQLRSAGVHLTDRRAVKVQRLVAAAAVLDGRLVPSPADLWPLVLAVPEREEQEAARETLRALLGETINKALPAAAEEASQGPLARATRLIHAGRELLAQPEENRQENRQAWQLKLEGIAREIDAAFAPEQLPEELATVRHEIVTALS
ncbi:MAG TPA: AAA family ATPase [Abditibacteriaceae bacterium]